LRQQENSPGKRGLLEAIVAATKIDAAVSAAEDKFGTIDKGKRADLLVLRGDPLKDIKVLRSVDLIIQGGKIVKPSL
jgi:imidazolonepropionase-like amidohydrolase